MEVDQLFGCLPHFVLEMVAKVEDDPLLVGPGRYMTVFTVWDVIIQGHVHLDMQDTRRAVFEFFDLILMLVVGWARL